MHMLNFLLPLLPLAAGLAINNEADTPSPSIDVGNEISNVTGVVRVDPGREGKPPKLASPQEGEAKCQVSCRDQYKVFLTTYHLSFKGCGQDVQGNAVELRDGLSNACAVTSFKAHVRFSARAQCPSMRVTADPCQSIQGHPADWHISFNCEIKKNGEVNKKIDDWGAKWPGDFAFITRCD